jgi:UDP-sulfoquinovose synthase
MVKKVGAQMGVQVEIDHLKDPRVEAEAHYYNAKHSKLIDLGLEPHTLNNSLVDSLINIAVRYRDRINPDFFTPQVNWRNARNPRNITKGVKQRELVKESV